MSKRANGDGTKISKHESGRWWQRVTLPDGKRKAFYGDTQKEVRQKREQFLADWREGRVSTDATQPTGKYLRDWLRSHQKSVKVSTQVDYARQVELAASIHTVKLGQLKPAHLQVLYDELAERGLSASSIDHVHRVLRIAFRRAVKLHYLPYSPTEAATPPRPQKKEFTTLSIEQAQALLDGTRDDNWYPLWVLFLLQGLRSGEALGLRWSDVDFETQRLSIRQTVKYVTGKGLIVETPKTATSRRTLTLAPLTVGALRVRRSRQLEQRLQATAWERRPEWQDLVFTTDVGGPVDPTTVGNALHRALRKAALPAIRVHDLRHTYATLLCEAGCDLIHVQRALGHSSYHLTADTYTHVKPDRSPVTAHLARLFPVTEEAG